jgi:ribosome-interacting GTPase 1
LVVDLAALELLDEIEDTRRLLEERRISLKDKKTLLVANKLDQPGSPDNFTALQELFAAEFSMLAVSAESGEGLDALRRAVFDLMGVVRVYTKAPGKTAEGAPYVLRRGSTALDVACHVHKDFAQRLKYARVWGHSRFEGQMVDRHYVVEDRDVIEFHV